MRHEFDFDDLMVDGTAYTVSGEAEAILEDNYPERGEQWTCYGIQIARVECDGLSDPMSNPAALGGGVAAIAQWATRSAIERRRFETDGTEHNRVLREAIESDMNRGDKPEPDLEDYR